MKKRALAVLFLFFFGTGAAFSERLPEPRPENSDSGGNWAGFAAIALPLDCLALSGLSYWDWGPNVNGSVFAFAGGAALAVAIATPLIDTDLSEARRNDLMMGGGIGLVLCSVAYYSFTTLKTYPTSIRMRNTLIADAIGFSPILISILLKK
jgi:hypothetical protein